MQTRGLPFKVCHGVDQFAYWSIDITVHGSIIPAPIIPADLCTVQYA